MEEFEKLDYVPLSKIKSMCEHIEKATNNSDTNVSFEYLMASLFPSIMDNIKQFAAQKYREGYIDGQKNK